MGIKSNDQDQLAALILELSKIERRTTAGVDAIFTLAARLSSLPEFDGPPRMVIGGRGSHAFSTDFVAQRLMQITRDSGDPSKPLEWLHKVAAFNSGKGGAVKLLYGVKCPSRIALSDKIELLPFSEVPLSSTLARPRISSVLDLHRRRCVHCSHVKVTHWRLCVPGPCLSD
jgi:hypothetical protein